MEDRIRDRNRRWLATAFAVACLSSSVTAQAADSQPPKRSVGDTVSSVRAGAQVFERRCAGCHGDDARGGFGPNLVDAQWIYGGSSRDITVSVAEGRPGGMPAWAGKLSPTELKQVVAFVRNARR